MIAVLGTIGLVIVFVVVGVLVDRKVSLLPRPEELAQIGKPRPLIHAAGTAPETALACTADELTAHLAKRRCACKGKVVRAGDHEPIRYDGRELIVVPLTCASCGTHQRCYATITRAAAPPSDPSARR